MPWRWLWATGVVLVLVTAHRSFAAEPSEAEGRSALAWRLDSISTSALGPSQPDGVWRRSAALLDASSRLDPSEPRFPRLRVLVMQHLGDNEAAITALVAYRKLAPADKIAQEQLIHLYARKLETVDAKLAYLEGLLDKENIPGEVRSEAASQCVTLLLQKSKSEAADMAQRAVQLYPLPEATRQFYELVGRALPIKERVDALVQLLKANPLQPPYLAELGSILASSGWSEESLPWYGMAIGVIMRSGPSRPPEFHNLLIDYASQQIIAGHGSNADTLLGQMLDELPLDADAWFLKLTVAQNSMGQVTYSQTLELAKSALVRRWNQVHDEVLFGPTATQPASTAPAPQPATTAPTQVEPLDAAPVLAKLKETKDPQQQKAVEATLSDLAWFELYYDQQPDAAKRWIDLVAQFAPADSQLLPRLQGWLALQSNQVPQAREVLSKTAEKDPLSALGLIRCDQAEKKPINRESANILLDQHRVGLLGAIIWEALRSEKITPATQPAAEGLVEELKKFPKEFGGLLDPRSVHRIYDVRSEPLATAVPFGDPILLRVTIANNSDSDVTIGTDALLRPDLWFDAQTLGLDQQMFRGVTYDQIANELVLRPHASTSQIVRLDAGDFRKALEQLPTTSTRLTGQTITNPVMLSSGVAPGPGGFSGSFARSALQTGISLGSVTGKRMLDEQIASSVAINRLRALDLMAAYVRLARRPEAGDDLKKATADLPQTIARLRSDSSPIVAAWASYISALLAEGSQKNGIAQEMSRSPDWTTRLLSLLIVGEEQKAIASRLANEDPDATVKADASATAEMLQQAATQPAATQPAATNPS